MDKAQKDAVIDEYKLHEKDTGSTEVQVAVLTHRIRELTDHLRTHRKDNHSKLGLLKLVGHRRSLLGYLNKEDVSRYTTVVKRLGLRK